MLPLNLQNPTTASRLTICFSWSQHAERGTRVSEVSAHGIDVGREAGWASSSSSPPLATTERDMYREAFDPESNEISIS